MAKTAIVITSSWVPSHPSTSLLETVINSTFERLIGLQSTTPIFITVDHFPYIDRNVPPELGEKIVNLEDYANNVFHLYLSNQQVHILPNMKNLHIGGSVMKAMELIMRHYPNVKYMYSLQHDFYFNRYIDHVALIEAMEEHPEKVNYVRFPKRNPNLMSTACGNELPISYNLTLSFASTYTDTYGDKNGKIGGNEERRMMATKIPSFEDRVIAAHEFQKVLMPTSSYSDNNHLVRFSWYKNIISSLKMLTRPPESPLMNRANDGCAKIESMGLYLYYEMCIGHLDGDTWIQKSMTSD
ncbi:hypothetical protein ACHAW5_000542 [Stephanodiscus triporus]|uniref:Uncharacterized protein n=1 Tax=Stephanodiscus triporus TaxID=2934178 RepID=A0ABD3PXZ7_9STRA